MSAKQIKRNYYKVEVPTDIGYSLPECGLVAISEIENRTKKYFLPQTWQAKLVATNASNYVFQVVRFHH